MNVFERRKFKIYVLGFLALVGDNFIIFSKF